PIVSNLQGEDSYLDALPKAKSEEAWNILRQRVDDIDGFIPVSHDYAQRMGSRLGIDESKLHVVHNGIALDDVDLSFQRGPRSATIGYLARMCPEKGLETLIEAFIELVKRDEVADLKLIVCGVQLKVDRPYVARLQSRLREAGCLDRVEFRPNVTREAKLEFLKSIDVLSVPANYGEAFGLYLIEALAHGVPVVQPRHGAFPEIIERTGGGLLCEPENPVSLADELQRLLQDRDLANELSTLGKQSVIEYFNAQRMASEVASVYDGLLQSRRNHEPSNEAFPIPDSVS
ncbi:MAG: glycosyltransferase family 4 protein, partial [Planctomycetota bacterium]|nr:glycosyltransferase family 4 protein [Planctomycetota bacterium]